MTATVDVRTSTTSTTNPYVGPYAFTADQQDQFFGRNRESRALLNMLIAERIVLLYSPSGAGKTSLIQAALVPALQQEQFNVLPVMRVSLRPPNPQALGATAPNRFILSLLLSLEESLPVEKQLPLDQLAAMDLVTYLKRRRMVMGDAEEGARGEELGVEAVGDVGAVREPPLQGQTLTPNASPLIPAWEDFEDTEDTEDFEDFEDTEDEIEEVLIFDQFEEILTVDPGDEAAQREFFSQVGKALRNRSRRALFAMREEFVAALDPFRPLVPTRLDSTYRLDLLRADSALEAIQEPARWAEVDFTDAAAARLVNDLSRVYVQKPDGNSEEQPGVYVEPVQLQIVCLRLWKELSPTPGDRILESDIGGTGQGDVDTALEDYYAERVAAIANETGVRERSIRDWIENELLIGPGIRGHVLQEAGESQGLANRAIRALVDAHLVRAEQRGGATWFELAHDRLVAPVKKNNADWRRTHLSPLQSQAEFWEKQDRPARLLMRGGALGRGGPLAEAERWAQAHQDELTPTEREFLAESRAAWRIRQRNLLFSGLAIGLLIAAFVLVVIFAIQANYERNRAEALGKVTLSRQLTLQGPTLSERPELALLLGVEANRVAETVSATDRSIISSTLSALAEARSPVLDALQLHPYLSTILPDYSDAVISVAFSPDGETLAAAGDDGTVTLRSASGARASGRPQAPRLTTVLGGHKGSVRSVAFSADGKTLASGSSSSSGNSENNLILWDLTASPPTSRTLTHHEGPVYGIAFNPKMRTLASAGESPNVLLWDLTTSTPVSHTLKGQGGSVIGVAFSPNGKILACGRVDNTITLWDVANPAAPKQIGPPLEGHKDRVFTVAFSPDGNTLASGGADNTIILWDVSDPARPKPFGPPLEGHTNIVTSVGFSPDGKTLASGSIDKNVILWDVANPAGARPTGPYLTGHGRSVRSVAFSPDGNTLASGGDDHTVILWDLAARYQLNRPLTGHAGSVDSLAFSPDGRILASAGADNTIILWDVGAYKQIGLPLYGHKGSVTSVAFSPDGRILASASVDTDTNIILWDVANPAAPKRIDTPLKGHKGGVNSVAFSPNRAPKGTPYHAMLASGGSDGTIILWDVTDPATPKPFGPPLTAHTGSVNSVAFSPISGTETLASGSADTTIILWDVTDPARPSQIGSPLTRHTGSVSSVAFSPDGKTLASGGDDTYVILWDVATGKQRGTNLIGHDSGVKDVAFSPDGRTLASCSGDKSVILWDVTWDWTAYPPIAAWRGLYYRDQPVSSVAFSPDGKTLASGRVDSTIVLWGRGALVPPNQLAQPLAHPGHTNGVYSVIFSPDGKTGKTLASGGYDKTITLWDLTATPPTSGTLSGHTNTVYSVAFSPDGKTLASGGADNTVILWDLTATPPTSRTLSGFRGRVFSVAFSPDGKTLASGSVDTDTNTVMWDLTASPPTSHTLSGHKAGVLSVAFSPDREHPMLASGSLDKTIILWDVTNPAAPKQIGAPLTGHAKLVYTVAFTPDGKRLASGSDDNTIILWDVTNPAAAKAIRSPLGGSGGSVNSLAFSPDGKTLAAGTGNQTVVLWDVATHKALTTLGEGRDNTFIGSTGQNGAVNSVAFSPDGKTVASGSDDYTIFLWDVDPASWKERGCAMANRNMTKKEWEEYMPADTPYDLTCPNLPPGQGVTLAPTAPTPAAKP